MNDQSVPKGNLAGMFIGAAVPFELAGQIFKAFYAQGINPSSFEMAPIYDQTQVVAAVEAALNGTTPPQITDGTKRKRRRRAINSGGLKNLLIQSIIVKPHSREELKDLIKDKQWSMKSLDSRLYDIVHNGLAMKDKDGLYHPLPAAKKLGVSSTEEASDIKRKIPRGRKAMTQEEYLISFLEKRWPKSVGLMKLKAAFERRGWRPEAVSVYLTDATKTGKVLRVDAGVYQFNKETKNGTAE